ncbi:hypothetical protein ABFS82_10G117700 [Erythranthe guttata]|uniref:Ribosomal protein S6 n=1 Tax=Erythranthe guttata TaxID=4155 RepID=A0A022QBE4_ERYGU|nr:PREDICTED: uncharacterized protein LOC105971557 [Erythranthe guttata]XP_012851865.1 PREDICTED: uncharacterized protein LOC105971557 [Erythranthe guttata]EYU25296.1 hypothetical protein MIMGU_mgv1a015766mg [Erythranthe guttata]|eukprot:XP_012851864.1 PREDICTED: uncharacterized protein LOC105971557 [Erythranthe guttata]
MPLYDCMLLLKPNITKEVVMDLVARVGKHVYQRNGVLTDMKSFGKVQLGYGIKKLDGRYYQAQLMQMTMMTPPSFKSELSYLNKEDRLLRWLLVKHRSTKFGTDLFGDDDSLRELRGFRRNLFDDDNIEEDDDDEDDDDDSEGDGH